MPIRNAQRSLAIDDIHEIARRIAEKETPKSPSATGADAAVAGVAAPAAVNVNISTVRNT